MLLGANNKKQTRTEIPCNQNVVVIGSSGSGKTYNYILSNLLQMNHSAVIFDPMSNLYNEYGEYFRNEGVNIYNYSMMPETVDKKLIEDICSEPVFVFLTPSTSTNHGAKLFINALWHELTTFSERIASGETKYKSKHKRDHYLPCPIHFYLDEFGNLNHSYVDESNDLKEWDIVPMLATSNRYGIGFSVILQSVTQLDKKWESICGNADAHLFINCISPEDISYISKKTELSEDVIKQIFDNDLTIICSRDNKPILSPKLDPKEYTFPNCLPEDWYKNPETNE